MPQPPRKAKDPGPLDGARFVRPGFAWEPEGDLAFALGYPHQCALDDGDDTLDDAIGRRWLPRMSRALAPRVARVFAAAAVGPQPVAAAIAAAKATPLRPAEAKRILARRARGLTSSKDHQLVLLLEALVGAPVVAEGIVAALEGHAERDFRQWNRGAIQLVRWGLGFALLRSPAPTAASLRPRLEEVFARAVAAARPDQPRQLEQILDVILHGAAGAERSGYRFEGVVAPHDLLFVHDDPAFVLDQVQRHKLDALWIPWVRLAFLGGEAVVAHYARHWRKIRDTDEVRGFVRDFGRIRSPAVKRAITEIAATPASPASADAAAWLGTIGRRRR